MPNVPASASKPGVTQLISYIFKAAHQGSFWRKGADAPHLASVRVWTPRWMQEVFEGILRGFRCFRVSGLLMQPSSRLLACMEIADRVQIAFARSRRPDISLVFPTPSADRCAIPLC